MAELRVIKGGFKIRNRHDNSWLADRYIDNAAKTLTAITRGGRGTQDPRWTKYVYLIVKAVVCRCHATKRNDFESLEYAVELLGTLTPKQIETTFPPTKEYDGDKYECKDYFSAIRALREYPSDKPVGYRNAFEFLMDYYNKDTNQLAVCMMLAVSDCHKAQTGRDIWDDYCEEAGIEPPHKIYKHVDRNGKEFFTDGEGKVIKTHKRFPRYLRVVP
jgi:hypothetical protein